MKLFKQEHCVGIFRGFSEGGLEFHADLILGYKNDFQSIPMHGQFILVQLETEDEAVLGRITAVSSEGRLASSSGENYSLRAAFEDRDIPEDLREQYLKYRIDIRVLGVLRLVDGKPIFAPSHRRLPHIGSKVAFLSDELLKYVVGHDVTDAAELGFFALGEFVYAGDDARFIREPWMQGKSPAVVPKFSVRNLVARRTFVFARAGFGKSNLIKLLFSDLYRTIPRVKKRGDKEVPVGTLIFDPDGEYYWPDDRNRPGLCDISHLKDKVVVFTKKEGPSPYYQSFVVGDIKLDIRRLRPSDVITIALPPERQDQQNVRKLRSLNDTNWRALVDLISERSHSADIAQVSTLLGLEERQDAEALAARSNMAAVVRMLHDPRSQTMDLLIQALKEGKICVVDVSQMRGTPALILSGLILRKIFDHNQEEFTKANPQTIPTIAVVEEAQSVLSGSVASGGEGPYIEWVKEGRKYDLGAVLITQQPGSINTEILSQGDNWFIFHMLSSTDLQSLKRANAHFSDDLLSSLLNEPIPGNCLVWSSVESKPYPVSTRIMSFEKLYTLADPEYNKPAEGTFAATLKKKFDDALLAQGQVVTSATVTDGEEASEGVVDVLKTQIQSAIEKLRADTALIAACKKGTPWMAVQTALAKALPEVIDESERNNIAFQNVPTAMNEIFGKRGVKWSTEKKAKKDGSGSTTWVKAE